MAFKFQLGEARMSGSLIQEGDFQLLDDDGTVRVTMARDNGSITGSAMSLSDGNLTNVGAIFCDVIEPDASGVGLSLVFGGDTTKNKMSLTDNLADALNIEEGGASYMKFVTTNGSEQIVIGKNSTFNGTTIANLGTVSAATSITSTAFVGALDGIVGGNTPAAGTFTALIANDSLTVNAGASIVGDTTNEVTLAVQGVGSQTAALFEVKDSDSNVAMSIAANRALTVGAASFSDQNITNVGDIALDSISADGASFSFGSDWTAAGRTCANLGTVSAATSITSTAFVGPIDGILGGNTPAAATVTTLSATGDVDLGDATSDTITATGRFDSDLVPSSDSARSLGSDSLRWSTLYVDSIVGADVNFDVEAVAGGGTIAGTTDYALITSAGTVTLPAAAVGKRVYVKLGNATANVTLSPAGGDALPEVTGSLILESTGSAVTLVAYDATNWYIN